MESSSFSASSICACSFLASSRTKTFRGRNSRTYLRNPGQKETTWSPKGRGWKSQAGRFDSSRGPDYSTSSNPWTRPIRVQFCGKHHQKRIDSWQGLWEIIHRPIWNGACWHLKNWRSRPRDSEIQSKNQQKQQKELVVLITNLNNLFFTYFLLFQI